jgi:hypothetical protein
METEMKTKSKIIPYIIHGIAATALLVTAQISLASSATWLSTPQDSAWENPNNWTPGGPPNGPPDIATFAQSSQTNVDVSTSVEVNGIVFNSGAASFTLAIPSIDSLTGGELIISGTGVVNNSSVLQTFETNDQGRIIFNNTSTAGSAQIRIVNAGFISGETIFNDTSSAGHASIINAGAGASHFFGGRTIFNNTSTAANASIDNSASGLVSVANASLTIFKGTSTAGHATITNHGGEFDSVGGQTIFKDSSTADGATLIADGGSVRYNSAAIIFDGASTGGTARVEVFDNGYLDISRRQPGVTIGSIEGSGNVLLGANRLAVGTNNINTSFSGVISGSGLLSKVGSGILTLQANDCIADTVGLILVTGSIIKLDFAGPPDIVASLKINGVPQPPGIYGGPLSGAPNILPEVAGTGTVSVGPLSILGNISTRAFVQTGDDVMIGGFIVQGTEPKKVIIRAIGPELGAPPYNVPYALANPTLELHDHTGALIASNDNWTTTIIGGIITSDQVADIRNTGYAPTDQRESAIIADLPAGSYTAIVRGVSNTTGVALAEAYDLNPQPGSTLRNISTRSFVRTGDNVMIGGFIVAGNEPKRVIIRAIGPELTQYGVPNSLTDPTLELHDSTGALIAPNDNWQHTIIGGIITSDQVHDIIASGHAPGDGRESAIIATLPPGNYTAILRGVNNTMGVALVEVYDLDL